MTNKDIQLAIQENFEFGVDSVWRGEKKKFKGLGYPELVKNSLKNMGFVSEEDWDTNGWQWDWFETWKKDGRYFVAYGQGHDGTCGFELSDVE